MRAPHSENTVLNATERPTERQWTYGEFNKRKFPKIVFGKNPKNAAYVWENWAQDESSKIMAIFWENWARGESPKIVADFWEIGLGKPRAHVKF